MITAFRTTALFVNLLSLGIGVSACGQRRTELAIVLEIDPALGARTERVILDVRAQEGEAVLQEFLPVNTTTFPVRRVLVPRGGDATRSVSISASAEQGGTLLTVWRGNRTFVSGESIEVRIRLDDACVGVVCDSGFNCLNVGGTGTCEPDQPADAGADSGLADVAMDVAQDSPEEHTEACAFLCSGVCVDLTSDATNCGACGRTCSSGQICEGGLCVCDAAGECQPNPAPMLDIAVVVESGTTSSEVFLRAEAGLRSALLALEPGVRPDVHIGVVNSDLGIGRTISNCTPTGFDGRFVGSAPVTCTNGANVSAVLSWNQDSQNTREAQLSCVFDYLSRTTGCGVERFFDATLRALTAEGSSIWSAPYLPPTVNGTVGGFADSIHSGFHRPDAVLGIFFLAQEDDYSVDPNQWPAAYSGQNVGAQIPVNDQLGRSIEQTADILVRLRRTPRRVVVGGALGLPPGTTLTALATDPSLTPVVYTGTCPSGLDCANISNGYGLVPVCNIPLNPGGFASGAGPSRRIARLMLDMERRGAAATVGSICGNSYEGAFTEFLTAMVSRSR